MHKTIILYSFLFCFLNALNGIAVRAESLPHPKAGSDIVIQGDMMTFDTKKNITTAQSTAGFSTIVWSSGVNHKKLYAKIITAVLVDSKKPEAPIANASTHIPLTESIESVSAQGDVKIVFESMTADKEIAETTQTLHAKGCASKGRQIVCSGEVDLVMGNNKVSGDKAIFDLDSESVELFSTGQSQVSAHIHQVS